MLHLVIIITNDIAVGQQSTLCSFMIPYICYVRIYVSETLHEPTNIYNLAELNSVLIVGDLIIIGDSIVGINFILLTLLITIDVFTRAVTDCKGGFRTSIDEFLEPQPRPSQ